MPPVRAKQRAATFLVPAVLAGALMVAAFGYAGPGAPAPDSPLKGAAAPGSRGSRLIYPSDQLPTIALANGERRQISSLLKIDRPLHYGDYVWDDAAVPAGEVWVRIDLQRQTMSVFRSGHEIGTAVIVYGTDGKATPRGVFPVLEKAEYHRSSAYDAEMPFMLRLTNDGVAVHASTVRRGAATHGCVGIPYVFAQLLFAQIKRGDEVAIS